MKRRTTITLLTLSLLLGLVLWHTATDKNVAAAMQANYPLNPTSFTSLGASPFTAAGTYTINASKNNANPILTKPDNTTIQGVFFTSSGGEIAVFTFDSINIPANVTVQGVRNANSRPIALLSKGTITIAGIVDVSGAGGGAGSARESTICTDGNCTSSGSNTSGPGGNAGPGGGGGGGGGGGTGDISPNGVGSTTISTGDGGTIITINIGGVLPSVNGAAGGLGFANGSNGANPSGGNGGVGGDGGAVVTNGNGRGGVYGGGGAFGGDGGANNETGAKGTAYGDLMMKLQGGSGGGGQAGVTIGGNGGGGGGGAIEIGAVGKISIAGTVNANGGAGAREGGGGAGGGILVHGMDLAFSCTARLLAQGGKSDSGGGGGGGRVYLSGSPIISEITGNTLVNVTGGPGFSSSPIPGSNGVVTTSVALTISQIAAKLVFGQQPTGTTPKTALSPSLTVRVLDACDNLVTASTASITLALDPNPSSATLGGNTANAVGGIATFGNVTVSKTGTGYKLKATSGNLTLATSNAFDITCQAITVSPATGALTAATVGTAYAQQFSQTSGNGTISWSIAPRSPSTKTPPGLSIDSMGILSGTPTEAGNFSFTVTATDGNTCPGSTDYTLAVKCPTITLPTQTLSEGTYNSPYTSVTINPTGGTAPYSFTVSGLPAGMTRTPSAGNTGASLTIGGTPTQSGDFTVQVAVTDAYGCAGTSKNYALRINKATPRITWSPPAFLPSGPLSAAVLNATANVPGMFSYNPAAGTVLAPGSITLMATFTPDDQANYNGASQNVMLPVLDSSCGITVNPVTMPAATRGTPFVQTLSAAPTGSYVFSLLSGQLPPGVNLVNTLGIYSLRGIPTTAGEYRFTIKAKRNNSTCEGARTYTMVIP